MEMFRKFFFSMESAVILFLIFAVGSAAATIIERFYSTQMAWYVVYGAGWFACVQLLLGLNLAYNIFAYKLINLKKLPSLVFHASFLLILIGAGVTRYFGFEGNMHIRENTETNVVSTRDSYVKFSTNLDGKEYSALVPKNLGDGDFSLNLDMPDGKANLKFKRYVPNAGYRFVDDKDGVAVVEMVLSKGSEKQETNLLDGEEMIVDGITFTLNSQIKDQSKYVAFSSKDGKVSFKSNVDISVFDGEKIKAGSVEDISNSKKLYTIDGINFSMSFVSANASRKLVSTQNSEFNAIVADVNYKNQSKEVVMFYNLIEPSRALVGDNMFFASWGAQEVKLPFSLYLKDFELKRYPGSNSPMGYASDVVVKDSKADVEPFDYRIYMNNVLDYDAYRFFQSSYDQDEQGTILSVNKDPGKIPTYIGYFLMGLGFLLNVINPHSRFRKLARLINESSSKKIAVLFAVLLFALTQKETFAYDFSPHIDASHAQKLSKILVQSQDGRIKPFDTISKDVLNKIYRKDSIGILNSNQAVLSIMLDPGYWRAEPIIALGSSPELKGEIGVGADKKYASFNDFFIKNQKDNAYKLTRFADIANRKHPGSRNTFDKDVIKVDERVNVFYITFIGEIFKVFPKQDDPSNTWYSPYSAMMYFPPEESDAVANMMKNYFSILDEAISLGQKSSQNADDYAQKWKKADEALDVIIDYQKKFGGQIMPKDSRIDMEILFNKAKIFDRLTPIYLLAGLVLLVFVFVKMLSVKTNISKIFNVIYFINILAFLAHTAGLGLRWYISEHAPWSNAYESMIYIAWALSLSGIIFSRQSPIAMALTSILAGVTLFVAHLSWMDPQITTLVPVLQSYWLTIHVSVITASYGFLGLCALLGFFVLVLIIIQNPKKPNSEISRNITEATRINEMAMILGLSLLTLGNFLGGVWANESWGRYWGWDSKETWALISILVYAAVLHLRFIPKLNNQYAFAVSSMFAYWAIIMTYFGVNFYLAGMHSYASGDPIPVPNFVYVMVAVMIAISVFAYFKRKICTKL
ncbi:cytochrome c biogenesis protein CcsA [Campylobacter mucosalis]|uniref:cytochrome c biogenesis protein CcsA n=1 Tax=Campylobacter mucosalis TaxID=202 RepID=UPI0014700F46|nr:cytochrome c biogenesis protein CcsA [Campylobacter mucosalis]